MGTSSVPRLSIIIPTLGDWEALETTLVAVLQNRPAASEIVVVLNRPYDDPYDLRGEVQFLETFRRSRLVDLINAGFAAARGEIIHVLAGGAEVSEGWIEPALRHFSEPQTALVAPLIVDRMGTRVLTAGCAWSRGGTCSAFGSGAPLNAPVAPGSDWIGPELFSGFYRRAALAEVGTFDATLPAEMAAIDLALRVRQAGRRSLLEPECRVAISDHSLTRAPAFSQGWHSERLFWRHLRGGSTVRKLAAHAVSVLLEAACAVARPSNAARLAGRAVGLCDQRQARRTQLAQEHSRPSTMPNADLRVDGPHPIGSPQRGGTAGRAPVSSSANEARS
jgi:GT2 family glycosyltransferase